MPPRARLNSSRLAQDDPAHYLERVIHEHEDIFSAIARRDPESARAAMRTHLSNSRKRLRRAQALGEGAGEGAAGAGKPELSENRADQSAHSTDYFVGSLAASSGPN